MTDKTRQDWLETSNSGERMSDLQLDDVKTDENSAMVKRRNREWYCWPVPTTTSAY